MRVSKIENLQTAEKSRGWLEFWRNSDQKKSQRGKLFDEKNSNERNERKVFEKFFAVVAAVIVVSWEFGVRIYRLGFEFTV